MGELNPVESEDTEKKAIKDPLCNCDDEFKTTPCPVHFSTPKDPTNNFGEDANTITDVFLVPERMRTWEGFVFRCPSCNKDSIMVNSDMAIGGKGICSNGQCGKRALIRSKIVTDFVNSLGKKEQK